MRHHNQTPQPIDINEPPFDLHWGDHAFVSVAHPDDAEVQHAHFIQTLGEAGVLVHVVIASDGTESTKGDTNLVKNGGRRGESRAGLASLGVPLAHQHYLGLPDGSLDSSYSQAALSHQLGRLFDDYTARLVVTQGARGYREDTHPDHLSVHRAALHVAKSLGEITVMGLHHADSGAYAVTADPGRKAQAIAAHQSQFPMFETPPDDSQEPLQEWHGLYLPAHSLAELAVYATLENKETYDVLHSARAALRQPVTV